MALNAFVELLRPFNCLMAALAVFIGYCLSLGRVEFGLQVFLAMASAFLVCGGGQAVNDYFDRRVDARLKRWRPIPSGRVSARAALWFAVALFVFGSLLGLAVSALLFGLAVLASLSLFGYSAFMGKVKFVGNWLVAFFVALTYVYGAAITGGYSVVVWLALCAGLSNAGREIV
ncbi:MAG: UbiA family prenyltransferase, partial [Candidatus Norongarragalinales archaeon]